MGRPKGKKDSYKRDGKFIGLKKNKLQYSFARQFLTDHKIEIYRGEEQILLPTKNLYDIKLPNTRFYVGEKFIKQKDSRKIKDIDTLRRLGLILISRPVKINERWEINQKVVYEIVKSNITSNCFGRIPKDHYIEHDTSNKKARLIGNRAGRLGAGQWIKLVEVGNIANLTHFKKGLGYYSKRSEEMINKRHQRLLNLPDEKETIYIKEIAFMITDSNEIVCFPKLPDMPSILITGLRGSGKSFLLHSLVSRFFWNKNFNYKLAIMNDSSRETGSWCKPNNSKELIDNLRKLHEKPLPLPCVYLHPMVAEDYEKLYMGNVGFDVTIPWETIINNSDEYLDMKKSMRYFSRFQDDLLKCKTQEEAEKILDGIQEVYNVPSQTANKLRAEFYLLFKSKMTDISTEKQDDWRTSKNPDKKYNALTACLHAGVIPVLETEYISNNPKLLSIYFRYFAGDIFNRQKQDVDFVKEKSEIMLVTDEIHNISGTKGTIGSGADQLLRRCVREGRPRRLGSLMATQKFGELPDVIKNNTTFLICFKNTGEATKIANQYNMGSGVANVIKDLGKHEFIAYTTDYFIVYDNEGNSRKSKLNEVFKGRSIPPYSDHKKPKS